MSSGCWIGNSKNCAGIQARAVPHQSERMFEDCLHRLEWIE